MIQHDTTTCPYVSGMMPKVSGCFQSVTIAQTRIPDTILISDTVMMSITNVFENATQSKLEHRFVVEGQRCRESLPITTKHVWKMHDMIHD